jgi:hypothetical protein
MDRRLLIVPLFALAGCVNDKENEMLVAPNPFSGPTQIARAQTAFPQANIESAARVDQLGRKILAANPQIGLRPYFCAIGSQNEEVFHQGNSKLIITEGLVRQCKSDADLAAILCRELGKMVAEREALASPAMRKSGERAPIQVHVGRDAGALADDGFDLAELARYEKRGGKPSPYLPDPSVLARIYLKKAGYPEGALDEASPLFKAADKHSDWEKQMNTSPARPFTN